MIEIKVAIVIIAGGQSRRLRLDGGYKWQLPFGQQSLLDFVLQRLEPLKHPIALNLPSGCDMRTSLPIIHDQTASAQGPLAGLETALNWAQGQGYKWLATLPCDTPFFPNDWLEQLEHQQAGDLAVIASCHGRWHPLFGLWPTSITAPLNRHFQEFNTGSMLGFCRHWASVCEFESSEGYDPFFNINDPQAYRQALKIRKQHWPEPC